MTDMTNPDEPINQHSTEKAITTGARFVGYLVYFYVIFVEIILILGFFLLLFGANSSASFVQWAYRNLDRAMNPFRGIFTPIELGTAGSSEVVSVFDTSVIFAMIIYAIIGLAVHAFIQWLTARLRRIDRLTHEEQLRYENRLLREQLQRTAEATTDPTPVTTQQRAAYQMSPQPAQQRPQQPPTS
jgi:uncharacterized membrane protein YcjF (UPF0283 family)